MSVILLGVNNPRLIGEVVSDLLRAGNAVTVEGELIPWPGGSTLLVRIEYKRPVNEGERAVKIAWKQKMDAIKTAGA